MAFCSIQVGDQFGDKVDQGPHNSKVQYDKIMGYIKQGKEEGATLHLGGNAVGAEDQGYFIEVSIPFRTVLQLCLADHGLLANDLH